MSTEDSKSPRKAEIAFFVVATDGSFSRKVTRIWLNSLSFLQTELLSVKEKFFAL